MAETHIKIGDITPRSQFDITAPTQGGPWTYLFPIFADADMEVYYDGTKKTLATHYTVAGAGQDNGGSVTPVVGQEPAVGVVVTLRRRLAIQRTSDFQESGEFRSKVINDELDYLTAALQQVSVDVDRTLRLGATDPTASLTLPDKAARTNKYLGFDANGDSIATDALGPQGPQGPAGNMDGSNNLSELTSTTTARTNLGLGTAATKNTGTANGEVVLLDATGLPAVDGSQLTGLSSGATDAQKANIILNAFRISVNGGLSVQNMVDGVVDEFEDETGVDTGGSTNESYDATGDLYTNNATSTEESVSSSSFSNGNNTYIDKTWTVDNNGRVVSIGLKTNKVTTGNLHILENTSGTNYAVRATVAYSHSGGGGFEYFTLSSAYTVPGSGSFYVGVYLATGTSGGTTATASAARTYITGDASGETNTGSDDTNPTMLGGVTYGVLSDMTLISNSTTALATPTEAFIVLWQEDVDAITLNTDLKAYASRDGGTTSTQITLTQEALLTTGHILTGTVNISGQPSGTSMEYKIETLNTKEQKIHGVGLEWS